MKTQEGAALPGAGWWRRFVSIQQREARRIITELLAARGLMPLLMKARNGQPWSAAEKEDILRHLRRMAHLSPYLLALLLPGSALLLPLYAWWLDRRRQQRAPASAAPAEASASEPLPEAATISPPAAH